MAISTGSQAVAADVALGANMPSGAIIIWHGTIGNIPAGWLICDGNNSTPNLLTRFLEGVATAATDPGATGGATSKDLDVGAVYANAMVAPENVRITAGSGAHLTGGADNDTAGGADTSVDGQISNIRPLFYDVAFLMKS